MSTGSRGPEEDGAREGTALARGANERGLAVSLRRTAYRVSGPVPARGETMPA